MSVAWQWFDENPNVTGGCLCYTANNGDQPKCGGWVNNQREFHDLGHQSPHVFACKGCPNLPKDLLDAVEVVDAEVVEDDGLTLTKVPAKRKAARATD